MNPNISTVLELLKESKTDLRSAQDKIRNSSNTIILAAFAISAYLLKEIATRTPDSKQVVIILADITLIAILLLVSNLFSNEVVLTRLSVEHYERELIRATLDPNFVPTLFPEFKGEPKFKANNDNRIVYISILIIALQMLIATALTLLVKS